MLAPSRRSTTLFIAALSLFAVAACDDATTDAPYAANTDVMAADNTGGDDATADGVAPDASTDIPSGETVTDAGPTPDTVAEDSSDTSDANDTSSPDVPVDAGPVYQGPIGGQRPAAVTLPDSYDPQKAYPLVFLLHGYSASGFIQNAYLQFSDKSTNFEFIAVVPEGTKSPTGLQFWNATSTCCDLTNTGVDDEGYLVDLIDEAKSHWNIDRVYFMGHSNGGFMSYRMACNHADKVSGIVSIAGSSVFDEANCQPSQPVSVLQIHGTLDTTITYPTGLLGPGAEPLVDRWVGYNNCAKPSIPDVKADYDTNILFDETEREYFRGCDAETEVGLWKMVGSGHIPVFKDNFMPDVLTWLLAR